MIDKDLIKHAREFKGYLDNHQYEVSDEGILFPAAGAMASGEYFYDTNGENPGSTANLLPEQGLNSLLEAGLRGGAARPQWFLAIFSGAYTPTDSVTGATFANAATEIVSSSEGYSEVTRRPWNCTAAVGGTIDNVDVWGRRRLAYEIKKNAEGIYAVISLQAEPATVKEFDRQLSLNESILRTKVIRPGAR